MRKASLLAMLLFFGVINATVSALILIPNTTGNYSEVTAYGANIFGWHMAWVTSKWTFATSSTGQFLLDRNTYIETSTGGHLGDYGSWEYTQAIPSTNELEFWGYFTLHGLQILGNNIHGVMYNRVLFNGRTADGKNYQYQIYYGVNYIASEEESLPVAFSISIEV
ncbi:hypothetical protein [Thermococcus waiotapuensis]|uniref:Uncharacterized protein n=1 Tax=Thermococcus waiotapuensis TaxID=90909 RepID=A0AAE4NXQ7_9EURY|nr:hypothetical protein [Thermococcus waiotapuensis]MDV3104823.1 hypothetical protein [Thermococcus waiotapuensis]